MIKISNMKLPVDADRLKIMTVAAKTLGIAKEQIISFEVSGMSVDARKKSDVHYVCTATLTAENEEKLVEAADSKNVAMYEKPQYSFPAVLRKSSARPVVVGMGPGGLFAALELARAGMPPIILERGKSVEQRTQDVELFWDTGALLLNSNVQFGEGGAGTFSDGKLTTGINDPRIAHVFESFVEHGAPEDIKWAQKPHIGTDVLRQVVVDIRRELLELGCDIRFEQTLTGLEIKNGSVTGVSVEADGGSYVLPCDTVVLAPGHSARDTFSMLFEAGVPMQQKAFAVGVRIEHSQSDISTAQYGVFADKLPPADYKLACHLPNGRSAFTFCVCPGGQVIAAANQHGQLVTNGMSLRARDGENINGGFLVGVNPSDFRDSHPLSGVKFQEQWEGRAFLAAGGNFYAPVQTVGDFLKNRITAQFGKITPSYKPGVKGAQLRACLPGYITDTLAGALPIFDRSIRGFANPDAVMTGVETRSSSPVRILRGEDFQSEIRGLYPCGEGAGYAGGITSAAVDGIKVAEAVATNNK